MAVKFTLVPSPTFKVDVTIPRAGLDDGILTFTFRHMPVNEVINMEKVEGQSGLDFAENSLRDGRYLRCLAGKIWRCLRITTRKLSKQLSVLSTVNYSVIAKN